MKKREAQDEHFGIQFEDKTSQCVIFNQPL